MDQQKSQLKRNPWFDKNIWSDIFEELSGNYDHLINDIVKAVYLVAKALDAMLQAECKKQDVECLEEYVLNPQVSFPEKIKFFSKIA